MPISLTAMHPTRIGFTTLLTLLTILTSSDFPSIQNLVSPIARGKLQNHLVLAQTSDALKEEAARLVDRAFEQAQTGQFELALQSWQQAFSIYQKMGDRNSQGGILNSIGLAYRTLGQYQKALESLQQALSLLNDVGDRGGVGTTLSNMGLVYSSMGQYSQALKVYQQALVIKQEFDDRRAQGTILNNIGTVYRNLRDYQNALSSYQQALTLLKSVYDKAGEGTTLNNIGGIYDSLGQYTKALEVYQQALTLFATVSDRVGEGTTLNNIGVLYRNLGEYQKALDSYQQALGILQDAGKRALVGTTLNNLGEVYDNLGQHEKALEFYQQALAIRKKLTDKAGEGTTLNSIGAAYRNLGNYQKSLDSYQQALAIKNELGDVVGKATTLNNIGNIYLDQDQYAQAVEVYQQALAIYKQVNDRPDMGTVLNNMGSAFLKLGDLNKAIDYQQQSLAIARDVKDRLGEGAALENLGNAYYQSGNFVKATETLRAAIEVQESLRPGLSDANKVSIFETQVRTYEILQKALVAQNNIEAALEIAERGRARAFVELLAKRLSPTPDAQLTISPPTIQQIRQIARSQNATLVEYSIISDRELFIWVVNPTGEVAFRQVDLTSLNSSLDEFVSQIRAEIGIRSRGSLIPVANTRANQTQRSQQRQRLQQLYQLLIQPIAEFLPKNATDRVILIPQKSLFLVPFSALQDSDGKYLIEQHTILTAPAIQVLALTHQQRQRISGRGALVVGNPTIARQHQQEYRLVQLPGAQREAIEIATLLKTTAIIGDRPTKSAILQQISNARIIHLATHGLLDDVKKLGIPGAIILAPSGDDNGLLTAGEILDLKLNAELVVLSACDTGQGKLTGDGVIGLSRSLFAAGVPSAIVTLWKIPDDPTASLMTEFYQNLQQNPDKAQALRQAMLTTMKQYPNPLNWAAFTLIGEAQ
jgi:CHAT domain-containing protein/Tfp pilus assembly protein PilF